MLFRIHLQCFALTAMLIGHMIIGAQFKFYSVQTCANQTVESGTVLLTMEERLTLRPMINSFMGSSSNSPLSSIQSAASMDSKSQHYNRQTARRVIDDTVNLTARMSSCSHTLTLTAPSAPTVISSSSEVRVICFIGPAWQLRLSFRPISTLIRPPSQISMFPHSEPESTWWREEQEDKLYLVRAICVCVCLI